MISFLEDLRLLMIKHGVQKIKSKDGKIGSLEIYEQSKMKCKNLHFKHKGEK